MAERASRFDESSVDVDAPWWDGERLFRRLFEESPVGIAMVGPGRRILRANAALCEFLGYGPGELDGVPSAELIHPDDVALDGHVAERLSSGEIPSYVFEKRYVRKDGEVVLGRLRASMIHSVSGDALLRLAIVEDITEEREADEARRELEAMRDAFVRVVSHDLQDPLLAIGGLAGILAEDSGILSDEEKRRLLGRIRLHADRLRGMVASFLAVDRLRHGVLSANRAPTDIADLVDRAVKACELGDRPLSLDVATGTAHLDPELVEHILTNLLENAVHHTPPETPVWVRVGVEPDAVVIVVEDAGPGVAAALQDPIFELFRTGDPAAHRTGIGLWVVARFAELHGGRAWVEDRPGGGASFRIRLPSSSTDAGR